MRHLEMEMETALGSRANVHEVFELFIVIESTRWDLLPQALHDDTNRAVDYHPGPRARGADYFSYDP